MTRHVLDRDRSTSESRAKHFLEAERREGLSPRTGELMRRPRSGEAEKAKRFLQIERKGEGKV